MAHPLHAMLYILLCLAFLYVSLDIYHILESTVYKYHDVHVSSREYDSDCVVARCTAILPTCLHVHSCSIMHTTQDRTRHMHMTCAAYHASPST